MKNKETNIQELKEKITLDVSILESHGVNIKSALHKNIICTLLSIVLNSLPEPQMDGEEVVSSYDATDKDKKRQYLKDKVTIINRNADEIEQRKTISNIVRVRFMKIRPE